MKLLHEKFALIRGSARRTGHAFAQDHIAEGEQVAIADINYKAAQKTANSLAAETLPVEMDATKQESIDSCIEKIVNRFGKLDILVNNVALFSASPTVEVSRNVSGILLTFQAAAKQMISQGHGGKIINMASQAGRRGEQL